LLQVRGQNFIRLYYYNSTSSVWSVDYDLNAQKFVRMSQIAIGVPLYTQFDLDSNYLYATSTSSSGIYKVSHLTCNVTMVPTATPIGNIAADPVRQYFYYSTDGGYIVGRMNYDGTNVTTFRQYNQSVFQIKTDPARNRLLYVYNLAMYVYDFTAATTNIIPNVRNFNDFNIETKTGYFYFSYFGSQQYSDPFVGTVTNLYTLPGADYFLDSDIESTTGLLFMTVGHTPITKYDFQVVSVGLPAFTLLNAPTLLLSVPQNIISLKTFYCTPATCGICGSVYTFPVTPTGGIDKGAPLFYLAFITIVALLQM